MQLIEIPVILLNDANNIEQMINFMVNFDASFTDFKFLYILKYSSLWI